MIVPTLTLPALTPSTDQVTVVFALPVTVAVNCWVWPFVIALRPGLTDTATPVAAVTVTVAVPDFVGSAADTALTVTVAGEGTAAGAV